jgi:hypothetical protein
MHKISEMKVVKTISDKYIISLEREFILTPLEIRTEGLGCSQDPFITLKLKQRVSHVV